ncbi:TIGR02281 family clan AA aspartic protease [Sphingomonas lutea]|uniref:TIGR02281 family clan AA aspartic protease n=1 Tax=Sphingomonas lutea TaxID=1045317 RepID=A0A7G9SJS7_9SPHN|nr:TIGR02281 family clan AA aspartic protease [Sphingomonas lutea]QNN68102.1 TIGR02281 family clan AA aspartic protease [Sphingomonas lutea]
MPTTTAPDWLQLAIYAVLAAVLITLLQRLPYVGRFIRFAFSFAVMALLIFLLLQHAPFEPTLGRIATSLGLDRQQVVGDEVRIRMSRDGHFWANVRVNGVERRMLIDSGATITALSDETAAAARIERDVDIVPIMLRTANGMTQARPGTVQRLEVGSITATDLKVVTSPALGGFDVLGMNFLSRLASWRVEGQTLVLVPEKAEAGAN